ncbi:MAG TPA: IPT/TIG domain-containing protein, partial [Candidatus Dormibacteraeota bacterium]|nr:IPT/TIG domain-containing protein [Candidatus Dormibacteraeota bacterium]
MSFELNEGQTSGAVRFIARGAGYPLYLTAGDAVLVLANPSSEPAGAAGSKAGTPQARPARPVQPSRARSPKTSAGQSPSTSQAGSASAPLPDVETGAVVRLHMVGANPSPQITGEDRLPGITNYLIGRSSSSWIRGIASYAQVRYHDVYPGVDLVYHANSAGTGVEYDYVLAAGADASQIAVDVQGADSVKADGTGGLAVASAGGQLVEQRPAIYQDVDGARHAVSGGYRLTGPNRFGFSVGAHDPSKPVVVDPQLSYLTYLGGNLGQDQFSPATGVAVDAAGSAYTAGYTFAPDFPTTTGAFQTSKFGDPTSRSFLNTINAFVSKLAPDGRSLVYSTYLGGTGQGFFTGDRALAIALDSANDAYVTGDTSSPDFPTTPTAFQAGKPAGACATCTSAFVSELNPSGSALLYSTYVGGSNQSRSTGDVEGGKSIAVDASGKIFVGGAAASLDFPTTPTAFQRGCVSDCATNADGASTSGTPTFTSAAAFFTPFDAGQTITGANIPDNTFIQSVDSTTSITLGDGNGTAVNATATGTGLTFTIGGRGFAAAFAAKLDPAMSGAAQLRYATLLGGSGTDANVAYALGLDGAGDVYLAGKTRAFDFPTTNGALATRCEGCSTHTDGVTTSGMTTFTSAAGHFGPFDVGNTIFGTDIPSGTSIAAVTNATTITLSQPATATGSGLRYDAAIGNVTGFVARLDPSASGAASLVFSTFLGGSSPGRTFNNGDVANGIAVDPATHRAYVTGTTTSPDFPTTSGALERACDAGRPGACGANPTFADGTSTNGSATYRSATAQFTAFDEGANIAGPGIPDGTYVQTFVDSTTVTLSNAATATGSGAFILGRGARTDAFVTELAASGGSAVASTFLGGPDDDASLAIALDGAGHVHVAGNTSASTYPSVDPVAAFGESAPSLPGVGSGGPEDATVTELDGGLSSIVFSTTLGGGNADTADTIAVDASGAEYVAGNTKSTDLPTTPGAFRSTFESNQKAWAAKIAPLSPTRPLVLGASPEHGPIGGGTTVTVRGRGFTGASAVAFGGVPAASFQVDSDTQVTAVSPQLPAGTAFADVTVTAAGGTTPANPIDRFTVGDGEWNPTGPIDADRNGPTATLLANGKVLVVGGTAASRIGNPPAFPAELYDALTGTWSAAAAPNLVWANGSAVRLADGRVLLVGGTFGGIGAPQAEIYDPVANTWTVAATPTSNHGYGSAALLQTGQVLAIGGFGGPSAELYDPAANTWSPVGSVSASFLIGQTETLLPDGEVLVAGGCCTTGPGLRTDAELYDPLRRTFTATGSMGAGRWAHTATLLPNGDVLVAGGAPQQGDSFAWTAEEVYHPATGTWALEGVMDQGSQGGGAALLPNGRVLLAGGTVNGADLFSPALSTAELFDPANPLGQVRADRMTHGHGEYNGRLGGHTTALVLLS